ILGHHAVAGSGGVARQLLILLGDMVRGPADLHIGTVRLIGPRQRIRSLAATTTADALVVALISWSHSAVNSQERRPANPVRSPVHHRDRRHETQLHKACVAWAEQDRPPSAGRETTAVVHSRW